MAERTAKRAIRRHQVREQRAKASRSWRSRVLAQAVSWPVLIGVVFVVAVGLITLLGEMALGFAIGQRIDHPVYARLDFQVPDDAQTAADREAARASTRSRYTYNNPALTFDRIRADLMTLVATIGVSHSGHRRSNAALLSLPRLARAVLLSFPPAMKYAPVESAIHFDHIRSSLGR